MSLQLHLHFFVHALSQRLSQLAIKGCTLATRTLDTKTGRKQSFQSKRHGQTKQSHDLDPISESKDTATAHDQDSESRSTTQFDDVPESFKSCRRTHIPNLNQMGDGLMHVVGQLALVARAQRGQQIRDQVRRLQQRLVIRSWAK